MAILIDAPNWWHRERWWGHMVSDESYDELHAFAERLGVPRRGFERDHYDIPEHLHEAAIEAGAVMVSSKELVTRLRAAGLRRPKPRPDDESRPVRSSTDPSQRPHGQ
jgi:hypothetical protein